MAAYPSAVGQKIQVVVTADTELTSVRIIVHGRMTSVNVHGLDPVVRRAGARAPDGDVVLDLSGAQAWESVRTALGARAFAARLARTPGLPVPLNLRVVAPLYLQP